MCLISFYGAKVTVKGDCHQKVTVTFVSRLPRRIVGVARGGSTRESVVSKQSASNHKVTKGTFLFSLPGSASSFGGLNNHLQPLRVKSCHDIIIHRYQGNPLAAELLVFLFSKKIMFDVIAGVRNAVCF